MEETVGGGDEEVGAEMELTDLNAQTQAQAVWVSEWTWHSGTWMQWEGRSCTHSFLAECLCLLRENG